MPSLRRSNTTTAVARAGAAPYATAAALSWSSSSSSSTRTASQQRRVSDPTQTKTRRVLADIDWWLVHDGQVDPENLPSEDESVDENLEAATGETARPPMAVASLPRQSPEPEWLRRVRDGDVDGAQVCINLAYLIYNSLLIMFHFTISTHACPGFALPFVAPHQTAIAYIA